MKKQVKPFNLADACATSWKILWAENVKRQKAGQDYRGQSYYLTATDLERQVRSVADQVQSGLEPTRHWQDHYGYVKIRGLNGLTLLDVCRKWLSAGVRSGAIVCDENAGRGHCSGMKFAPAGEATFLLEKMAKRVAARQKPKTMHLDASDSSYEPLCRVGKPRKPRNFYGRPTRSSVRTTRKTAQVTCKQCLKLMTDL